VAIVDADVGQASVGPPATVTLGYIGASTNLSAPSPEAYYFVGSTNPVGRLLPMVVGTSTLAREASAPFVIVDTTGLIHDTGRVLKNYKIEALRPDVIVAIERRNELAPIRAANRHAPMIRLRPSHAARPKNDDERIESRRVAYAQHFSGALRLELPLNVLVFQRTLLFTGKRITLEGALHAEQTAEGPLIVGAPINAPRGSKMLAAGFEKNLICGVGDETGRCRGLGIIERIGFVGDVITLITPVKSHQVRIIQFGDTYIRPNGAELGQIKWAW
jgi:polynucleotide 5'-hydroxyl-kinase GRC3/NOL9